MEYITLTWTNWIFALLLIVGIYFGLTLLAELIAAREASGEQQKQRSSFARVFFLVYEPIALLLLLVLFVFVNPVLHGLLVAILLLFGYSMIKNYLNGRFFLATQKLKEKQQIKIGNTTGFVQKIGYIGIQLQTPEGLHLVDYSNLSTQGYTLLKGKQTGGLHNLTVYMKEASGVNHTRHLMDRLLFCPFIDWSIRPQINYKDEEKEAIEIEVLLRKEKHLHYLTKLLKDWGYGTEPLPVKPIH